MSTSKREERAEQQRTIIAYQSVLFHLLFFGLPLGLRTTVAIGQQRGTVIEAADPNDLTIMMEEEFVEEHKREDIHAMEMSPPSAKTVRQEPLTVVKTLLGDCLCQVPWPEKNGSQAAQFISIHGIEFIGLGAVVDELTPKERVYDTLEQLTTRTERLISIGYLSVEDQKDTNVGVAEPEILVETVPLNVWNKNYPNDNSMSRRVKRMINNIKTNQFGAAIKDFSDDLKSQRSRPNRGTNKLLAGITAHNSGVLHVLAGEDDKSIPLFEEAIDRKRTMFGLDHPEVAISLDELGIQFFAKEMFDKSLEAFTEARRIREKEIETNSHLKMEKMAMVLNNIACCNFQMGNHDEALETLKQVRDILSKAVKTVANADLDLLHVAITLCNYGYLLLRIKQYEDARSIFEEALLIQQSVLGDNHRAIRDTLSNIEFTNAFHS